MDARYSQGRVHSRRNRRYIGLLIIVVLAAAGWIGFWKFAALKAEETLAGWRAREAKAGRIYDCGSLTFGGFPFRFEAQCDKPTAVFRDSQPPRERKAANIHVATQVYKPNLLISEFNGPLTIVESGHAPDFIADWKLGQASVRGTPDAPTRLSLVFDDPTFSRSAPAEKLLKAKRIELHARIIEGTVARRPVIETAVRLEKMSAPGAGVLATAPIDATIDFVLRGLSDLSPKSWPARFREIQAAGGRIEISNAHMRQGETLAVGSGALSLNARGRLDGEVNLVVAGLDAFVNAAMATRNQQGGLGVTLGLRLLGGGATLEGRPAVALPLRVREGVVSLGPLSLGEIPPLF
jgi:hypothetical protein